MKQQLHVILFGLSTIVTVQAVRMTCGGSVGTAGGDVHVSRKTGRKFLVDTAPQNRRMKIRILNLVDQDIPVNHESRKHETLLHAAVIGGHFEIVRFLIEELCAKVHVRDAYFNTPLHLAAERGDLKMVRLLVSHGAVVCAKNADGKIPLELAAAHGYRDVANFLYEEAQKLSIDMMLGKRRRK